MLSIKRFFDQHVPRQQPCVLVAGHVDVAALLAVPFLLFSKNAAVLQQGWVLGLQGEPMLPLLVETALHARPLSMGALYDRAMNFQSTDSSRDDAPHHIE